MTRDAEHTPTGYEDAASVVVNQAPAPSSLAGGEVHDAISLEVRMAMQDEMMASDANGGRVLQRIERANRAADAILAALSPEAPAREGVAAKPLDWRKPTETTGHETCELIAPGLGGFYGLQRDADHWVVWQADDEYAFWKAETREAAIAKAESDWQRVFAAKALTPRHEAPVFHANLMSHEDNEAWAKLDRREAPASEDEARRKLIQCIEQWDGETEYDADDLASLADSILHAFNGPPVVSPAAPVQLSSNPCQLEAPAEAGEAARIITSHLPLSYAPDTVCLPITMTAGDLRTVYAALRARSSAPAEGAGEGAIKAACIAWHEARGQNPFNVLYKGAWCGSFPHQTGPERWTFTVEAMEKAIAAYLRARSSAPEAREEALGNLLAVIHGDGGHRALEVGTKQAALEAEKIVADLLSSAPEAREDKGNHDCLAKRRDGEPMFILLGRDPDAHAIVQLWADRRLAAGGDPDHCRMGYDTAERMKAYASDPANRPASAPDASDYPAAPSADKLRSGALHTEIMDRIREDLICQHSDAFTEEDGSELIIPSGCTPQSAFVKIDVSALADVALAALKAEGRDNG